MSQEEASPQPSGLSVIGKGVVVDDGTMEDLIDKMKLLRYETDFCPRVKPPFKPLKHDFEPPGQFDDPNATSTNILTELRQMNITAPNLAPNRIRQGNGEAVLTILSILADQALLKRGFSIRPVDYTSVEKFDELSDVIDGDDDNGIGEEVADNVMIESDDEDEVYVRAAGGKTSREDASVPVESGISAEEWGLEVERVAPLLQVKAAGIQDWRSRIENATVLLRAVEKMYPEVKQMILRLTDDLEKSKERIQKREQTLAQQFSDQVEDYRVKLRELNTSQDTANVASQSVQQLSAELNQVSGMLDQVKRDIEERESKISDTTPLMQIKDAVMKVRAEIKQMSLRIGILQHTVLHYVKRQTKAKLERSLNGFGLDDMDEGEFPM